MSETIHKLIEYAHHIAENIKTAATVAGSTIAVGVSTVLDKLPDILGIVATLLGICLSALLIRGQIDNHRKIQLEINELKAREAERKAIAALSPGRRHDDEDC